jgi:hypothetical protein
MSRASQCAGWTKKALALFAAFFLAQVPPSFGGGPLIV